MNSDERRKMYADIDEADRLLDLAESRLYAIKSDGAFLLIRKARRKLAPYLPKIVNSPTGSEG